MNLRSAWKFALIPAAVMVVLALFPQVSLWRATGSAWSGSYAAANYDEVAYSAYINGLIHGKSRKYDPYMGEAAEHESIFSIQFIPAYSITAPAWMFGITASTTFILLQIFLAVFASLSIFYLLLRITESGPIGAFGTLVILCLGTAVTVEGLFCELVGCGLIIEYFPFLRRYQPGFGFPVFFLMCLAVWASVNADGKRRIHFGFFAGALFGVLVYTYFYLWTAAGAWVACLFVCGVLLRPEERKAILFSALSIGSVAIVALIPYFYLLNQRSRNSDEVQLLALTHAPDLSASTIIVGLVTIAAAIVLGLLRRIDLRSWPAIFAYAFALMPLVVLNQQVLTGRSLQPIHYEIFIANYSVLTGIVIIVALALKGTSTGENRSRMLQLAFAGLGVLAAIWGVFEAIHGVSRNAGMVSTREAAFPVIDQIRTDAADRTDTITVHSANPIIASFVPTVVPSRVLWTPHLVAGGSIGEEGSKQQFYRFLYFSGFKAADLDNALKIKWFEMLAAIFGGGRALPQLGGNTHPITDDEIMEEVAKYDSFVQTISEAEAYAPRLDYFILPVGEDPNFTHLDRWYERDGGTTAGLYKMYKLVPRLGPDGLEPR